MNTSLWLRSLFLVSLGILFSVASHAGKYFNVTEDAYQGFVCEFTVGGKSSQNSATEKLEFKRNGNSATENGKVVYGYDLTYTPVHKLSVAGETQTILTGTIASLDSGDYDLGAAQGLPIWATTNNFNEHGKTFSTLKTKIVRETGVGCCKNMDLSEELVIDVTNEVPDEKGARQTQPGFHFHIPTSVCKLN